ncbi:MAG: thiamine pyrophosphate-binding protein [Pseudomonadota bacterium]
MEHVFGIPGGAIEPIFNSLAKSAERGGIKTVIARHEAGAAFMADGYFRETGKMGVCLTTSGPGATNLITGLACAYNNQIPMLVITGQPALPFFGKGAFQESACTGVDLISMFRHCTYYSSLLSHQNQLIAKLSSAVLTAYQSQGPVHLSMPVDIMRQPMTESLSSYFKIVDKLHQKPTSIDEESVEELFILLKNSSRPVFFIGAGAAEAIDNIMLLVDATDALFVSTPDAKGLINPFHPAYRGVFGLGGHDSAIDTIGLNSGYTVAFGAEFDEFTSNNWCKDLLNKQLIHVDNTSSNLLHSPMARLHVRGRILTICDQLCRRFIEEYGDITVRADKTTIEGKNNPNVTLFNPEKYNSEQSPLKPQRLMKELSERFPPDTRFLADIGNSMIWAPHYLQPVNRRQRQIYKPEFLQSGRRSGRTNWLRLCLNFAPMGWAIGAAIGIARGRPSYPVVCIAGDGAYLMSGQEITVAEQESLNIIYVILNDSAYGMVMHGQRITGAAPIGYQLNQVDFAQQVQAMSIPGFVIKSPKDFADIDFDALLSRKGPSLLDVRIDPNETPPMETRLKTLGAYAETEATE